MTLRRAVAPSLRKGHISSPLKALLNCLLEDVPGPAPAVSGWLYPDSVVVSLIFGLLGSGKMKLKIICGHEEDSDYKDEDFSDIRSF